MRVAPPIEEAPEARRRTPQPRCFLSGRGGRSGHKNQQTITKMEHLVSKTFPCFSTIFYYFSTAGPVLIFQILYQQFSNIEASLVGVQARAGTRPAPMLENCGLRQPNRLRPAISPTKRTSPIATLKNRAKGDPAGKSGNCPDVHNSARSATYRGGA